MRVDRPGERSGIRDALAASSAGSGDRVAIIGPGGEPVAYRELLAIVDDVAASLASHGLAPGSRIATVVPDGPQAALSFLAIAAHWACAPLNPAYREAELTFYLADLDASAVLVASGAETPARAVARRMGIPVVEIPPAAGTETLRIARPGAAAVPAPARADDVALVLHTSGTTARPKLVPLTHANLLASARHVSDALDLRPTDRCLTDDAALPHPRHRRGAAVVARGRRQRRLPPGFDAPRFLDWLDEPSPPG